MPDEPTPEQNEKWAAVSAQLVDGLIEYVSKTDSGKWLASNLGELLTLLLATVMKLTVPIGTGYARAIAEAEDQVAPALGSLAAAAASDVFGMDISPSVFSARSNRSGRNQASSALGAGVLNTIKGAGGPIEPSDEAAKRYLTMVLNMSLEGWYQGWLFEYLTSLIPYFDIGKIENFAGLDDKLAESLGISRLTRRVLSPLLDATVVAPLRWQVNKTYGPELLGPSQVARMVARDPTKRAKGIEELRRQGYNDERIAELLAAGVKYTSAADIAFLVREQHIDTAEATKRLQADGYDPHEAELTLLTDRLQRLDGYRKQIGAAAISSYASREIDSVDLENMLDIAYSDAEERQWARLVADHRRASTVKRLTLGQAEAMVKSDVLNVRDYRAVAEREGYPDEDVLALELQLRFEKDREKSIATHRAELEKERAAEKAARLAEQAKRKAEIEAERALRRRGPIGDLERAVVRGLIPTSRLEEVLGADYDPDTVAILVGLVEGDRSAYLEQQAKREEAAKRAARRDINLGDLEQAVLAHVADMGTYRARLQIEGLAAGDIDILARTLEARLADLDAAKAKRAEAEAAAKARSIDLGRFEQLVRRGVRTREDYLALLEALGFADGARVAMLELLDLKIADDATARAEREAAETRLRSKGLSLEQFRRAVLLGTRTLSQFETFLVNQSFTADAIQVLVADLANAVDEAEAARRRREQADADKGVRVLPLATLARAARLGIVSPDTYQARLVQAGYSADDVAIELELLLTEIADVQAARAQRDAIEGELAGKGLSLAQLERAVKRGVAPIADYQAAALAFGYSAEAVETLVAVLTDEAAELEAARQRKAAIEGELAPRHLSIAQLEAAVKNGLHDGDWFLDQVRALGYSDEDGELLAALLSLELEAAAAKAGE